MTNDAYSPYTLEHVEDPAPSWCLRAGIACPVYDHTTHSALFEDGAWVLQGPEGPAQAELNAEARAYLSETDWYVVRYTETGTPVPPAITAAREAARQTVREEPQV